MNKEGKISSAIPFPKSTDISRQETPHQRAEKLANEIGLNWNILSLKFKEIFTQMDAWGHIESSTHMNELATKIFNNSKIFNHISQNMRESTLEEIKQGITLADIGKRGPISATKEQSRLIVDIFKINNIEEKPDQITVTQFVIKYLKKVNPEEKGRTFDLLEGCGIIPNMTMRDFYNLHTRWSIGIINIEPKISQKTRELVARHHTLDKVRVIDLKLDYAILTLEDKIVILLDQYDARRERSKQNHQDAIIWIKEKIQKGEFSSDKEFETLLRILDDTAPSINAYKEPEDVPIKITAMFG